MYGQKIPIMKSVEKIEPKTTATSSNPRFRKSAFGYEKGEIALSKSGKIYSYHCVKCKNPNLIGSINGELPIDHRSPYVKIGQEVDFELVKNADGMWYAFIRVVKWR